MSTDPFWHTHLLTETVQLSEELGCKHVLGKASPCVTSLPISFYPLSLSLFPCFTGLADKIWLPASTGPCHRTTADPGRAHKSHHSHATVWRSRSHGDTRSVWKQRFLPLWHLASQNQVPPCRSRQGPDCCLQSCRAAPLGSNVCMTYGPVCCCKE